MSKMTASQALRQIKDLKGKLSSHQEHAAGAVYYQDMNKPAFDFKTECEGVEKVRRELLMLQTALAVSNATTEIEWKNKKVLVAWAVRYLEELKGEKAWVDGLHVAEQAESMQDNPQTRMVNGQYQSVNEPRKFVCQLPRAEQFKRAQALQEEFNRLNDLVETSNHQTILKSIE
jgi:ferric iron reductase protein FhuF